MTNSMSWWTDSPDDLCDVCGQIRREHTLCSLASARTEVDCAWVSDLISIEKGVLADIFATLGVSVSGDVRRRLAIKILDWSFKRLG